MRSALVGRGGNINQSYYLSPQSALLSHQLELPVGLLQLVLEGLLLVRALLQLPLEILQHDLQFGHLWCGIAHGAVLKKAH